MMKQQVIDNNIEQGIAAYIDYLNNIRLLDLIHTIELILTDETDKLSDLAKRSSKALSNLELTKMEIDNLINSNRGGKTGLHGFISEFAEAGIRNARDAFKGLQKSVVLLNNNGPADILLHGKEVQMKFYANILEEIKRSSNYGNMKMMFPKDHAEVIKQIMEGVKTVEFNGNNLANAKINAIKKAVEEECALRGLSFDEWIEASVNKYQDVQKTTIDNTLSKEVDEIHKQTMQQKNNIKEKAANDTFEARQKAEPSFGEASKAAGIGVAVQGGFNLGIYIYKKHKSGKDVWNFNAKDWKECGISAVEGAIKGGISGYAIYGLTNICHLSAPSAGAIASGTFGLANAVISYRKGDVDADGFIDLVTLNAIDSTGAAIGATIGQTIIPIPIVGALVGSIVATTALSLGKEILNKHETEVINMYQEKINTYIDNLDKKYQTELENLLNKYSSLGELQQYAFNLDINVQLRFAYSIDVARTVGVNENSILKNLTEIDNYML